MGWSQEDRDLVLAAISDARPASTGWYRIPCPFCSMDERGSKKKMSVNADTGYFICFRATCGARGFVKLNEKHLAKAPKKVVTNTDGRVLLPEEFISLAPSSGNGSSIALRPYINYLYGRGLTDAIIEEANIGCCLKGKYATKIVVPVIADGTVAGFTSRSITTKFYSNPPEFQRTRYMLNGDALKEETSEPIIIVEGPFDCLRHWPLTVACFGKPTHHHMKQIRAAKRPVIFCLDADAQLEGWGFALTLELGGQDVKWMKLRPGFDPGKTDHDDFVRRALAAVRPSTINPDTYRGPS